MPRASGLAVALLALTLAAMPRASEAADAELVTRHGSVMVDPLGFVLLGPTVGVEVAPSQAVSVMIYGRWLDAGVVARSLFLEDDRSEFAFSYGVGLRSRYYLAPALAGFFAGAGGEYLRTRIDDTTALIATKSQYLVPVVEGGYRHGWRRFFAEASASLGYAFQLSGKVENLPGGTSAGNYTAADKSSVYGGASLHVGVFF